MTEVWTVHKRTGARVSDLGRVDTKRKGVNFGSIAVDTKNPYRQISINNKKWYVHRLVLEAFRPNPDPRRYDRVDHKDRIRSNNKLSNLQWSNKYLNAMNQDRYNVFQNPGGRWQARIRVYGQSYCLGTWPTKQDGITCIKACRQAIYDLEDSKR